MTDEQRGELDKQYIGMFELYATVKELVAACEHTDPEQRAPIRPIAELRSTLDHIMRAHQVIYENVSEQQIQEETGHDPYDYCEINLDKALGHLYRAGYDAYDLLCIGINRDIDEVLKDRSLIALQHVIRDFAKLMSGINQVREVTLPRLKATKDVESSSKEQPRYEQYEQATDELREAREILRKFMPQVLNYEREARQQKRLGVVVQVTIAIAALLAGAGISYFLLLPQG